jgi:serine/threonine protein kinase/formylglycine-generating enzyme required for sulfatase activity
MTPGRRQQVEDLYRSASQQPAGQRGTFLASACGVDLDLKAEVENLLAKHELTSGVPHLPADDASSAPTQPLPHHQSSQLGPYRIEGLLGAGGMGKVYRATDTRLDRKVAVKVSPEYFSGRFEREARAISALNHPNICTLYDVGPNYLVMELLDGSTLADVIQQGPLIPEQVLRYGAQIASALAEAHACGIIHRDLKPGNIMVTRHGVKVLDFGLAKMTSQAGLTETRMLLGTPAYMAPEQVEGGEVDARTDLFSLGLVLHEMATGKLPFPGKSLGRMLSSGSVAAVPDMRNERAEIPASLGALVAKLLQKDPAQRCQSAAEVAAGLSAQAELLTPHPRPALRTLLRPPVLVSAVLAVLLSIGCGVWLYQRSEQKRWASADAIPEINRLADEDRPLAAFQVLLRAERLLPGDARLAEVAKHLTTFTSVETPGLGTNGANVQLQDYLAPDSAWFSLGTTPIKHLRIPNGYFRWKITKPGGGEFVAAPFTEDSMRFPFVPAPGQATGMVPIPGGPYEDMIGFIGWVKYELPAFEMDRFEVTNREYQKFVDQGGYQKREYWKEKFVKDGRPLTWEQAMDLFRDPTGRHGPSTWEAGHFPPGQAEYPVSGVSWYEASAYAVFAGKTLPALAQWFRAAPDDLARYTINQSNFGGRGPIPVGASRAVGPYGNYDLAGNVREWALNAVDGDNRFILGGAWGTQTYQAYDPEALPPFDRSPFNGFRGVRNREPLSPATAAPVVRQIRNFSKTKPASDEVFQVYKAMYAYERRPLNVETEAVEQMPYWTRQRITIDAGYASERLPMYLFLPKNVHPPYQAIVFFPSARVNTIPSSRDLGDMDFVDYVIKSGRAVLYPIYRETYDRHPEGAALPGDIGDRDLTIQESKEVRRAVDYLETRPDIIDRSKLAYLGVSQGAAYGPIFTSLEDRFKAVVFLDGGFFLGPTVPGRDQVDFAPRLKKPLLMVNGKYDFTFPPDQSQIPMFEMIGTAPADKFRKVFEAPHDVSQHKVELSKEVLGFLDKYLGRVN